MWLGTNVRYTEMTFLVRQLISNEIFIGICVYYHPEQPSTDKSVQYKFALLALRSSALI